MTNENTTVHNTSGKRRGRKTNQIRNAFDSVTTEPVLLSELAKEFEVSEKVLRQAKRFDKHNVEAGKGRVRVTQYAKKNGNKEDKNLYIYREMVSSEDSKE